MAKKINPRKFRLIFGAILLFVVLALFAIKLWAGRNAEAIWFNSSWNYREAITVTNNGSTATNFQLEMVINTAALVSAGKMLSTCNDLRFADNAGTTQPYFIEKGCNTANTIVWIKLASVTGSATSTYYMYYGNSSASSVSAYTANGRGSISTGDGADGSIIVTGSQNINTTAVQNGHSCADGGDAVNYSVTENRASATSQIVLSTTPSAGCLSVGDEVLIINMQGTVASNTNVGLYETARITTISVATLTLNHALDNSYDGTTQKIMVQRIPNYKNVTICTSSGVPDAQCVSAGTLTATAWNGTKGGVVFLRSRGTVNVAASGTITASALGYAGGAGGATNANGGANGESYDGSGAATVGAGGTGTSTSCGGNTVTAGFGCRGGGSSGNAAATNPADGAVRGGGGGGGSDGTANTDGGGSGGGGGGYGFGGGGGAGNMDSVGNGGNAGDGGTGASGNASAGGGGGGCAGVTTTAGNGGNAGSAGSNSVCVAQNGTGGTVGSGTTSGSGGSGTNGTARSGGGGGGGGNYGTTNFNSNIYLGSGGGGGGGASTSEASVNAGSAGATAGGIVFIGANTITVAGSVSANGADANAGLTSSGGGGGGSGGSIYLSGSTVTMGTSLVTANGGARTTGSGQIAGAGAGANGRIATVDSTITGTTSPTVNSSAIPTFTTLGLEQPQSNLELYYKFDEGYGTTTGDSTPNAFTGTITSATWKPEELCLSANCLNFDGSAGYVSRSSNATSNTTDFTLQAWIRPTTTSQAAIAVYNGNDGGGYGIGQTDGTGAGNAGAHIVALYGGVAWIDTGYVFSAPNQWVLVTLTRTGTTTNMYVNGNQMTLTFFNGSSTDNPGTPAAKFSVGMEYDSGNTPSRFFKGNVDEVKVYTKALSATQVAADYAARSSKGVTAQEGQKDTKYLSDGLAAWWKFDETSGDASDSSGINTTLSNNNAPTYTAGKFGFAATFNGSNQYFSTATTLSSIKTVSFWTNPVSTTDNYINLASGVYVNSSSGTVAATGFSSPIIYVNGVISSTITANVWSFVTITTATGISADTINVGRANGSVAGNGTKIDGLRLYNRSFSGSEVTQLYNWAPGPFAYWKLDEGTGTTANDSSTNANTGTWAGTGSPHWVSGKYGSAGSFNGTDDKISTSNGNSVKGKFQVTEEAWIYPTSYNASDACVYCEGTNGSADSSRFDMELLHTGFVTMNGRGGPTGDSGSFTTYATSATTAPLNQWSHVVGVFDPVADVHYLYLNGVAASSSVAATGFTNSNPAQVPYIGSTSASTNTNNFFGRIDDFKLYDYARSPSQIIEDMNAGHPVGGSPVGSQVAYWKMDEMSGTTANDSTINKNNLTLSAASWNASGKVNGAWNGTGSVWLTRADDADFDFAATDDFSISMWFKSDSASNPANNEYLYTKGTITNTGTVGYAVYVDSTGKVNFGIRSTSGVWGASAPNTITPEDTATSANDIYDGTWHHIVARKTGTSRIDLYVDGYLSGSDTSLTASGSLANAIAIVVADDDQDSANSFNGDLDEVKVYRAAMTQDQINVDYNFGASVNYGTGASTEASIVTGGAVAPVGLWDFEDNTGSSVTDRSGNGNTGTWNGTLGNQWASGKFGSSGKFNGTNNFVNVPDTNTLSFGNSTTDSPFSVTAWVKMVDATGFDIATKGQPGSSDEWQFSAGGGSDQMFLNITDKSTAGFRGRTTAAAVSTPYQGKWAYFAATYSGNSANSGIKLFINGIRVDTADDSGGTYVAMENGTGAMRIGTEFSRFANGYIDNLKVYNVELSQAQIAYDFNRGQPDAWWKMDETSWTNDCSTGTVKDSSWNTLPARSCPNGTGPTGGTSAKFNLGGTFDGSDDYVEIGDDPTIDFGTSTMDFSLFAWVKRAATGAEMDILSKEDADNDGYRLEFTSGNTVRCSVNSTDIDSTATITDTTTWHLIGCTINRAGNGQVYIDGKANGTATATSGITLATTSVLRFAARSYTIGNYFNGVMDDVRIYSYALSATQVQQIYNFTSTFYGPVTGTPTP